LEWGCLPQNGFLPENNNFSPSFAQWIHFETLWALSPPGQKQKEYCSTEKKAIASTGKILRIFS